MPNTPLRLSPRPTRRNAYGSFSTPNRSSPGGRSYGAYDAEQLIGSPGAQVVRVDRYMREVPRTVIEQEPYDVREPFLTGSSRCRPPCAAGARRAGVSSRRWGVA